ncbi:lantibiotic dehydratase [Streptomyces sp. NBC_01205]|uniref:lantibiotic dehydratase n=1 Tax=Streptomyces sp. NBC_01205 TaxID=2903771 RepID=UPI002E13D016|nr:lantibiotic dehydratase family protein [Streptomyces sp. NBC_01205]
MTNEDSTHLVPLEGSDWRLWRDVAVRSAGFPAHLVGELADPALVNAADAVLRGTATRAHYDDVYRAATDRLSAAIRRTAGDPLFREAVTWQNRNLIPDVLDKAAAGEPRNARGRGHETAIAKYLQRYTVKNDTIGFFGPVGWGTFTDGTKALAVTAGDKLLAHRTVYFESWTVDAVARVLAEDPELLPWITPRKNPANHIEGRLAHRPRTGSLELGEGEALLLSLCDGNRTVRELAAELGRSTLPGLEGEDEVISCLLRWQDQDLITLGFEGPIEARPEATLRRKLERIDDPDVRNRALSVLDRLDSARTAVAGAAGDAQRLGIAIDALNTAFAESTGEDAKRRHGMMYAGRTLVYEDTVRDAHIELGAPFRDALASPLRLVLESARWLLSRIGDEYNALFTGMYQRWSARTGETAMPLSKLLGMATPHLVYSARGLPEAVRTATADFQQRWSKVLGDLSGARSRAFASDELAEAIGELFPPVRPQWAAAIHHSPDVMLAATSQEAVGEGDYLIVLGELHMGFNPFESRVFVEQHAAPERLFAADAADHGDRRIYLIPPKDWPAVTSRLSPPSALLSPRYTYWSLRSESAEAPGPVVALADLEVHPGNGGLSVRSRSGDFEADLLEMLGELLSAVAVNAFKPLEPMRHRPRVTLDRLVLSRETWTFPASEVEWATQSTSEGDRFLAARAWQTEHGLPDRAFHKSPVEDKPIFIDFRSITLVNMLAKVIRATGAEPGGAITLSEMLPDLEHTWLRDATGAGYTAELRLLAVDPLAAAGGAHAETEGP